MIVGVTGGAGFIGGHVVDRLLARGDQVVVFDHRASYERIEGRSAADLMLGDIRDEIAVTELASHVEGIIHLASVLGTQETVGNPRPAVMTNVAGGLNVMEACAQYGLPMVNICVGNHGMANPYSASKTCVESLGEMFRRDRGLAINQVRAVNAYGPHQAMAAPYGPARVRKIMPAFIARALTGAMVEVYGDGEQVSDMVHVKDVADVLIGALTAAAAGLIAPTVVEVGPRDHATVNHVARLVLTEVVRLGYETPGVTWLPMRPGETPGAYVVADPSTLAYIGMDGWQLRGLESGVRETVEWFAENWLPGYLARTPVAVG